MFALYTAPADIPFSTEEFVAGIPDDATARGMFFDTFRKLRKAKGLPTKAEKRIPFKEYSRAEYCRQACATAEDISGNIHDGLFEIGRSIFPDFASSLIGKTMLMVVGRSFKRLCETGPRCYAVTNNYGEFRVESLTKSSVHFVFDGILDPPQLSLGIIRGGMDVTDVVASNIQWQSSGPTNLEIKIDYVSSK